METTAPVEFFTLPIIFVDDVGEVGTSLTLAATVLIGDVGGVGMALLLAATVVTATPAELVALLIAVVGDICGVDIEFMLAAMVVMALLITIVGGVNMALILAATVVGTDMALTLVATVVMAAPVVDCTVLMTTLETIELIDIVPMAFALMLGLVETKVETFETLLKVAAMATPLPSFVVTIGEVLIPRRAMQLRPFGPKVVSKR